MGSLFKPLSKARIQVTLFPNWHDVSQGGRFLYARGLDPRAGVLQVSLTGAKGASDRANSTVDNLLQLLQQRTGATSPCEVVDLDNGRLSSECWGDSWASALCEAPGLSHVQAWCVSRGDDLIFATYICTRPTTFEELSEAREIVFRLALRG